MQTSTIIRVAAATLLWCASAAQAAQDLTCRAGMEPGLSYHGDRIKLAPLAKRKILGTWLHTDNHLAISLEAVSNVVYEVVRSQYCTSGSHGRRLIASPSSVYSVGRGEYYRIESNGDLGVYDGDGRFDVYLRRTKVFAD
jgi:hypothetical protein